MKNFTGYYSERKENTYDHNTYDHEEFSKEKHADDLKQIAEEKHEEVERWYDITLEEKIPTVFMRLENKRWYY